MVFEKVKNWYGKYERPISSLSLIGGFVFDALTLKRVDLLFENLWVIGHLVIISVCMVIVHAMQKEEGDEANPSKAHFWLVNIIQFVFGGVLSTYLVFYFRSSDIAVSWPFLFILALCFWANESLKRQFVRLSFQVALLFLSFFSFAIFSVPVLMHQIGPWIFILSGIASLISIWLFLLLIRHVAREEYEKSKKLQISLIAGIFIVVNVLYFTNLIPPIPLALKDGGVYHSLKRDKQGNYIIEREKQSLKNYWTLYPDFHKAPGEPLYVFSAIFSPAEFDTKIFHEWQYKDPATGKWLTKDLISLSIVGGRDGGFRTYSIKRTNIIEGHWRVNVKTVRGQVIDRIRFNVVLVDEKPELVQETKK